MAGTDLGFLHTYPGSSLAEELELLVGAGLSPARALAAATLEPVAFLGRDDRFGSIAPGKAADLVLLAGNPLTDIGNVRRIEGVIVRGRALDRRALDELSRSSVVRPEALP